MRMNEREAKACLGTLTSFYHRETLPLPSQKTWIQTFLDFEFQDAYDAVLFAGKNCKWFPSIAEIRAMIREREEKRRPERKALPAPTWTPDNPEPLPGQAAATFRLCRRIMDPDDPMTTEAAEAELDRRFPTRWRPELPPEDAF